MAGETYNNQPPAEDKELMNSLISKRGCTDILCCLIFIAATIAGVIVAIYALAKGRPEKLAVP